jgi:hypothetical protein
MPALKDGENCFFLTPVARAQRSGARPKPLTTSELSTPMSLPFIPCVRLRSSARMELSLKPSSAKVKDYYDALNQFAQFNIHRLAGF